MTDTARRPQMVGIGSTVYDTLMVIDRFPTEDTKLQGIETKVQGGGPCATALAAARKLGISAAYMGTIGDDPFGTAILCYFLLEPFCFRPCGDPAGTNGIYDSVDFPFGEIRRREGDIHWYLSFALSCQMRPEQG